MFQHYASITESQLTCVTSTALRWPSLTKLLPDSFKNFLGIVWENLANNWISHLTSYVLPRICEDLALDTLVALWHYLWPCWQLLFTFQHWDDRTAATVPADPARLQPMHVLWAAPPAQAERPPWGDRQQGLSGRWLWWVHGPRRPSILSVSGQWHCV